MAITLEPAPESVLAIAAAQLLSLPSSPDFAEEEATLYQALPVYGALVEKLVRADGDHLPGLIRTGWRLLADEAGTMTQVDVRDDDDPVAIMAVRGIPAEVLALASLQAEAAANAAIDWQARILDLPQVEFTALWLHAPDHGDMVVRLDREEVTLRPLYEVSAEIRQAAQEVLADGVLDEDR
ncbi:hypothetical protein QLH51_00975 [Sphingomonas sp. 2R-10]|uniref:hypothetical protein n=1 Tax=Sphingomonas sp. 2R-10 TaxID=3045148 RepID=UPI000F7745FB|nr:hypothetical protein [Sphingomonas sp. 2R-10]MDJ0275379.1 hypothetical protein [Sphingomonas sp. 2R-10]